MGFSERLLSSSGRGGGWIVDVETAVGMLLSVRCAIGLA